MVWPALGRPTRYLLLWQNTDTPVCHSLTRYLLLWQNTDTPVCQSLTRYLLLWQTEHRHRRLFVRLSLINIVRWRHWIGEHTFGRYPNTTLYTIGSLTGYCLCFTVFSVFKHHTFCTLNQRHNLCLTTHSLWASVPPLGVSIEAPCVFAQNAIASSLSSSQTSLPVCSSTLTFPFSWSLLSLSCSLFSLWAIVLWSFIYIFN